MSAPLPPAPVRSAFETLEPNLCHALTTLRARVFEVATQTATAPLEETLKWGQPAYRPQTPKTGTTLRLWHLRGHAAIFVPCSTRLVDGLRRDLPDEFSYHGDRAILVGPGPDRSALEIVFARALTYHREKGIA